MSVFELTFLYALISVIFLAKTDAVHKKKMPYIPAGSYMTGPEEFIGGEPVDSSAPYCKPNEPCGYYSFDPATKRPLKWIPSWCQCAPSQSCVYSGHNKRLKTYVHSCAIGPEPDGKMLFY